MPICTALPEADFPNRKQIVQREFCTRKSRTRSAADTHTTENQTISGAGRLAVLADSAEMLNFLMKNTCPKQCRHDSLTPEKLKFYAYEASCKLADKAIYGTALEEMLNDEKIA